MEQNKEVVITETSRMQQMWSWWRAKLDMAVQSPWYASHLLRRFYDLMKALKPSKQLVASTVTGAALLVGSLAMNPTSAQAAGPIVVNSTVDAAPADDGNCTLREAIIAADTNTASGVTAGECVAGAVGLDTITLTGVNGTITLYADLPPITNPGEDIVLNGPGASNLTIDGNAVAGPFQAILSSGAGNNVTVDSLNITKTTIAVGANGNAIVKNSNISGNIGMAAVYVLNNIIVTNSTISGNSCTIALFSMGGDVTVTDSTISGNTGVGVGAMNNADVTNSTVSANAGGGAFAQNNTTVTNSTISGNGFAGTYGGVYATNENIKVVNSTITGNAGKGVFAQDSNNDNAVITLKNSLIVGNGNGTTITDVDCTSNAPGVTTLISNGHNLINKQTACTTFLPSEITTALTPTILSPLASNGGKTQTHALVKGSPAIDKGLNADAPGSFDQRGFTRILNGIIDIGAFESTAPAVGGVAEFITPPVNDGLMGRVAGMMGAGLAMGLGVLGLSRAKKTE